MELENGIWEKVGDVNITKAYIMNNETYIEFSMGVTLASLTFITFILSMFYMVNI
jgi:hypothetical protein